MANNTSGNRVETIQSDRQYMSGSEARPSKAPMIAAVLAALLVAAGGAWWYLSTRHVVSDPAQLSSSFDDASGYVSGGLSDPVGKPIAEDGKLAISLEDGQSVLRANGEAFLFASRVFKVDPTKAYAMKIRVRVVTDNPDTGNAHILAGFATFNAEGKLETESPGAHRYFVANQKLSATDGWREIEGVITGSGNETHAMFRPTTATATPVVILGFSSPGSVTELDSVKVKECADAQDCKIEN